MSEITEDKCGIVVGPSLEFVYDTLGSLQHRGRDAFGITGCGPQRIDVFKAQGPVKGISLRMLQNTFGGVRYEQWMGHVRYATQGKSEEEEILKNAHPHTIGGVEENYGKYIFIRDCDAAMVHNGQVDLKCLESIDRRGLRTACDTEALLHYYVRFGEQRVLMEIPGSYTLAAAKKNRPGIVVMRDRTGIKPGYLGKIEGHHVVASEDVALRKNRATLKHNLVPGSTYYLNPDGSYDYMKVVEPDLKYCFFEHTYLGHEDSIINRVSVHELRLIMGEVLAREFHSDSVDYVSWVPNSPESSAEAFAQTLGKQCIPIFNKTDDVRSFMEPKQEARIKSITTNLSLIPLVKDVLKGRSVIVIDDSAVRGTVLRRVRQLLYEDAGVRDATLLLYTPPIGIIGEDGIARGCEFGVDMPSSDNFIARGKTEAEISLEVGMPVRYISLEGMLQGFERVGLSRKDLCTYCIGGQKPF